MSDDRIEREITIGASQERAWELLTEAEHLGKWFADAGAEIDLQPGGAVALHWDEHGTYRGRVERVEPPRFVSFRWAALGFPDSEPREGNSTLVEFTLTPDGDGTRLRVTESGFDTLDWPEDKQREHREGNREGWEIKTRELAEYAAEVSA
jgi:uncharacterized protein YndB with AHSA1/START domain